MADTRAGTAKVIQYLNEAYGTEQRLETALEAHISMTTKDSYRKRLREHLTETKRHAREVEKRVKQLGGNAEPLDTPGPSVVGDAALAVMGGAQKAVALAQGPLHALRGTSEPEKMLKNAKTEYSSESEEIALYTALEKLAETVGDTETQRLARAIRREEERMRSFLEKEIPRLTLDVARAEIPASQRRKPGRSKAPSRRKATASGTRSRSTAGSRSARKTTSGKATSSKATSSKAGSARSTKAAASRKPARGKARSSRSSARGASGSSRVRARAAAAVS